MIGKIFKYFVVVIIVNFVLFLICYSILFAYDEGQLNETWFVKLNEFVMWIYRFPFQLNEINGDTYWINMMLDLVVLSSIISLVLVLFKKSNNNA